MLQSTPLKHDRTERHLMRQRGAGVRTISSNFGFSLAPANLALPAPVSEGPPLKRRKTILQDHLIPHPPTPVTSLSLSAHIEAELPVKRPKKARKRLDLEQDEEVNASAAAAHRDDGFVYDAKSKRDKGRLKSTLSVTQYPAELDMRPAPAHKRGRPRRQAAENAVVRVVENYAEEAAPVDKKRREPNIEEPLPYLAKKAAGPSQHERPAPQEQHLEKRNALEEQTIVPAQASKRRRKRKAEAMPGPRDTVGDVLTDAASKRKKRPKGKMISAEADEADELAGDSIPSSPSNLSGATRLSHSHCRDGQREGQQAVRARAKVKQKQPVKPRVKRAKSFANQAALDLDKIAPLSETSDAQHVGQLRNESCASEHTEVPVPEHHLKCSVHCRSSQEKVTSNAPATVATRRAKRADRVPLTETDANTTIPLPEKDHPERKKPLRYGCDEISECPRSSPSQKPTRQICKRRGPQTENPSRPKTRKRHQDQQDVGGLRCQVPAGKKGTNVVDRESATDAGQSHCDASGVQEALDGTDSTAGEAAPSRQRRPEQPRVENAAADSSKSPVVKTKVTRRQPSAPVAPTDKRASKIELEDQHNADVDWLFASPHRGASKKGNSTVNVRRDGFVDGVCAKATKEMGKRRKNMLGLPDIDLDDLLSRVACFAAPGHSGK